MLRAIALSGAVLVIGLLAVFWLETSSRQFDAYTAIANADRVARLGGTFYTTASEQKGPLWPALYQLAWQTAGRRDVWFAVAVLITLVAAATGVVVGALVRMRSGTRVAASLTAIAVAIHLSLGTDEFAHLLYSRNIVVLLSAASFWLLLARPIKPWRGQVVLVLAGLAMGLGIQTNLGSIPTAGLGVALAGVSAWLKNTSESRPIGFAVRDASVYGASLLAAVAGAPLLYFLMGVLPDFGAQWWTYNLYYSQAYGLGPAEIAVKGLRDFVAYYAANPLLAFFAFGFAAVFWRAYRRLTIRDRALGLALIAWWFAEMISVALSQRFFGHYLVLPFVPVAVMAGVLASRASSAASKAWGRQVTLSTPWAIALGTTLVLAAHGPQLRDAIGVATAFKGLDEHASEHLTTLPPERARLRQIVQANSAEEDYVYIWTNRPWLYADVGRTPATRYVERRWLIGQIYWAGASAEWILPGTLENWKADIVATPPTLIVTMVDEPVPPGSSIDRLLACGYRTIHRDEVQQVHALDADDIGDCL